MAKDYILHDASSLQDSKIEMLIAEYGMEGYGMFWVTVESMYLNDGFIPKTYGRILANKCYIKKDKVQEILDFMVEIGLIAFYEERYFSNRILEQIERVTLKRERYAKNAKARYMNGNAMAEQSQSNGNAMAEQSQSNGEKDGEQLQDTITITSTITPTITITSTKEEIEKENIKEKQQDEKTESKPQNREPIFLGKRPDTDGDLVRFKSLSKLWKRGEYLKADDRKFYLDYVSKHPEVANA